jgi:hypothetical protein
MTVACAFVVIWSGLAKALYQFHPTTLPISSPWQSKRIPEDERDYFLERRYPAFGMPHA